MPHPPIKLSIAKTVFGGDGLAEWNGKAVFVEGALPGETVEAQIFEEKKNFARARLLNVLEPSPERVAPPCPHAEPAIGTSAGRHCGGCQYQHVAYKEELRLKEAQVKEIFAREGLAEAVRPIFASEKEFGYRSSLTLHPVDPKAKLSTRLGFVARDNRTVIPVKNCLLADPAFAPVFPAQVPAKKCPERVTFKLDASGRLVDNLKESFLRMRLGSEAYLVHADGFFQTNPAVAAAIVARIEREIAAFKPDVLFDLFAGVGTFGLAAAAHCGTVVFVEESPQAVSALEMNVAERKLPSAFILRGRVERTFSRAWREHARGRSFLVLDPPRVGLDRGLTKALAEAEAGKMAYLSCDPVTLERDLKILRGGPWKVESLEPFDMFPKTKHVETLAILRRV